VWSAVAGTAYVVPMLAVVLWKDNLSKGWNVLLYVLVYLQIILGIPILIFCLFYTLNLLQFYTLKDMFPWLSQYSGQYDKLVFKILAGLSVFVFEDLQII
jgi:hypothetical protein